jgi:hypothetical protein
MRAKLLGFSRRISGCTVVHVMFNLRFHVFIVVLYGYFVYFVGIRGYLLQDHRYVFPAFPKAISLSILKN